MEGVKLNYIPLFEEQEEEEGEQFSSIPAAHSSIDPSIHDETLDQPSLKEDGSSPGGPPNVGEQTAPMMEVALSTQTTSEDGSHSNLVMSESMLPESDDPPPYQYEQETTAVGGIFPEPPPYEDSRVPPSIEGVNTDDLPPYGMLQYEPCREYMTVLSPPPYDSIGPPPNETIITDMSVPPSYDSVPSDQYTVHLAKKNWIKCRAASITIALLIAVALITYFFIPITDRMTSENDEVFYTVDPPYQH